MSRNKSLKLQKSNKLDFFKINIIIVLSNQMWHRTLTNSCWLIDVRMEQPLILYTAITTTMLKIGDGLWIAEQVSVVLIILDTNTVCKL